MRWSCSVPVVVALLLAAPNARADDPPASAAPGAGAAPKAGSAAPKPVEPSKEDAEAEKSALEEMLEGADEKDDPPAADAPATDAKAADAKGADSPADDQAAADKEIKEEAKAEDKAEPREDSPSSTASATPSGAAASGLPAAKAGGGPIKSDRRGEISDELVLGTAQATPQNPRQSQIADALRGSVFLSDSFTLNAGLNLTFEGGSPPPSGSPFNASYGGTVAFMTVGLDFDPGEHFSFGGHFDLSPQSEQFSSTPVSYRPTPTAAFETVDALLRTRSGSIGGGLSFGYDTAGDSDFESAFTSSVNVSDLSSDQRITQVEGRNGKPASANDLRTFCQQNPAKCSRSLRSVLRESNFTLAQVRLNGSFTETIFVDTDLTLSGDYYLYSDDPTQLGFFSVATAGRTNILGGGGVPIAPMLWAVRPEVTHRFGRAFSARLWVQAGRYVEGGGQGTSSIGTRLQYKFTRTFRIWMTLSGQRDVDIDGNESKTGSVGVGLAYKF